MLLFYPSLWVYGKVSQVCLHKEWQDHQSDPQGNPAPSHTFGKLMIPKLWLDQVVLQGIDPASLREGPGHFPDTSEPGAGNCCIAGHLNIDGSPFKDLDKLRPGDVVMVQGKSNLGVYHVSSTRIIYPDDVSVLKQTGPRRLTLVTCMPGARMRYVVICRQVAVY